MKKGVCASALIKKLRYWPKNVPGEAIEARMTGKDIGATDSIKGKLDGIDYNLFMIKDRDFTIKLMSIYGKLEVQNRTSDTLRYIEIIESSRKIRWQINFQYTEPFQNYYRSRHSINDHNHYQYLVLSIEGTCVTDYWEDCRFQFLLVCSEINTKLGYCR